MRHNSTWKIWVPLSSIMACPVVFRITESWLLINSHSPYCTSMWDRTALLLALWCGHSKRSLDFGSFLQIIASHFHLWHHYIPLQRGIFSPPTLICQQRRQWKVIHYICWTVPSNLLEPDRPSPFILFFLLRIRWDIRNSKAEIIWLVTFGS